jgi:Co/Zn/Cd efflux system component
MRALWVSLAVLGATAAVQAVVVALSGSVALLGDTLHNVADALTAVPLGIAFLLGRRAATRRYTTGTPTALAALRIWLALSSWRSLLPPPHLPGAGSATNCAPNAISSSPPNTSSFTRYRG